MVGTKFGRWTVIEEAAPYVRPKSGKSSRSMLVRCACGTEKIVLIS